MRAVYYYDPAQKLWVVAVRDTSVYVDVIGTVKSAQEAEEIARWLIP